MNWSWRLGRVNGAPVEVHWLFALLLAWTAFAGWSQGQVLGIAYATTLLLAAFGCVLLHEIGHTVQAQSLGIPVRRIVLMPFGGLAQLAHVPDRPSDELRVAAAGPAVNIALSLLTGALLALWLAGIGARLPTWRHLLSVVLSSQPGALHFLTSLTMVNTALVAFNLVPAFPLDGGRILRSGLALVVPRAAATRTVSSAGWAIGLGCLLLGAGAGRLWGAPAAIGLLLTGATAIMGSGAEEVFERNQIALRGIPVRAAVRHPTWCLQPAEELTPELLSAIEALDRPAWPVVMETRLVGLVNRRDLASARTQHGLLAVGNIMRRDFVQVEADSDLSRAKQLMLGAGLEALPVVDGGNLYGLLTSDDVRTALVAPPASTPSEAPRFIPPIPPSL